MVERCGGQCLCRRKERAGVISILVSVYNVKQMLLVGYRIIVWPSEEASVVRRACPVG